MHEGNILVHVDGARTSANRLRPGATFAFAEVVTEGVRAAPTAIASNLLAEMRVVPAGATQTSRLVCHDSHSWSCAAISSRFDAHGNLAIVE